ncbi:18321_t:CDS:2, partial [Gigaspora margarita]
MAQENHQKSSSFAFLSTFKSIFINKPSKTSSTITQTQLTLLNRTDPEYEMIKNLFAITPKIHGIVKLKMPTKLENKHEKYKKFLVNYSVRKPNTVTYKMFHGTKRWPLCDLLMFNDQGVDIKKENENPSYCQNHCGLCGILQQGNRKKCSKSSKKMWFAQDANTSLNYCEYGTKTKVMFVIDCLTKTPPLNVFITGKEK